MGAIAMMDRPLCPGYGIPRATSADSYAPISLDELHEARGEPYWGEQDGYWWLVSGSNRKYGRVIADALRWLVRSP